MCVNVRCSHKRGAALGVGRGGKVARGSLVSGKQAKAVVPRKWPQLFHSFIRSLSHLPLSVLPVCVCVWASGSGRVRLHGCGLRLSQWIRPGRVALPLNMLVTSTLKHKLRFTVAKRAKSNGKPLPPHSLHRPPTYYAHLLGLD